MDEIPYQMKIQQRRRRRRKKRKRKRRRVRKKENRKRKGETRRKSRKVSYPNPSLSASSWAALSTDGQLSHTSPTLG
jgi:hypothetical protein